MNSLIARIVVQVFLQIISFYLFVFNFIIIQLWTETLQTVEQWNSDMLLQCYSSHVNPYF